MHDSTGWQQGRWPPSRRQHNPWLINGSAQRLPVLRYQWSVRGPRDCGRDQPLSSTIRAASSIATTRKPLRRSEDISWCPELRWESLARQAAIESITDTWGIPAIKSTFTSHKIHFPKGFQIIWFTSYLKNVFFPVDGFNFYTISSLKVDGSQAIFFP